MRRMPMLLALMVVAAVSARGGFAADPPDRVNYQGVLRDAGAIEPGDLLVASATPGHAMRAPNPAADGTVLGKALEAIASGTGMVTQD